MIITLSLLSLFHSYTYITHIVCIITMIMLSLLSYITHDDYIITDITQIHMFNDNKQHVHNRGVWSYVGIHWKLLQYSCGDCDQNVIKYHRIRLKLLPIAPKPKIYHWNDFTWALPWLRPILCKIFRNFGDGIKWKKGVFSPKKGGWKNGKWAELGSNFCR